MAFNKEESKKLRLAYLACMEFYGRVTEFYARSAARTQNFNVLRDEIKREHVSFLDVHIENIKVIKSPFQKIHIMMQVSEDMDHDSLLQELRDLLNTVIKGLNQEQFKMNLIAHVHCAGINKRLEPLGLDKKAVAAWSGLTSNGESLLSAFMEPAQYLPRYKMLLEEIYKKIRVLDRIDPLDIKSIQEQADRLKTVITNLNDDWINSVPVYHDFVIKIKELRGRMQTDEVKEKIERLSQYTDELSKSFNCLEKTATSSAEMIKQLLNDPKVSKRTGFSFGASSVAKKLQSVLTEINEADKAKEQILLLERRRKDTVYSHLSSSIEKNALLEIVSEYDKSRGFWRKYVPLVPSKTKTMQDLTALAVKSDDAVVVHDVIRILWERDERVSNVRKSGLGSISTEFFRNKEDELNFPSVKNMSATDKAIQSLAKAFKPKL